MARITIEDCLEKVENRYELVHLATRRVKQLREGDDPLIKCKNKDIVTALREVAREKSNTLQLTSTILTNFKNLWNFLELGLFCSIVQEFREY